MSTQLLGTGVDGTTPCALLSLADGSRLLLNASEGLQRLASEHRLRLHRGLDAVLLTSVSPLAAAGLPGLLLTLAQKGAAAVHICGPPGTASLVRSLRPFANTASLQLHVVELTGGECVAWRGRVRIVALPVAGRGAAHGGG